MLLESLIAFVIAALALNVLFAQGTASLVATREAGLYQRAIIRAQSRLAALTDAALIPQDAEGQAGQGFHWHTHIVPLGTLLPPVPVPLKASPYAAGTTLYDVSVTVSWSDTRGPRAVTLRTQRLGPAHAD